MLRMVAYDNCVVCGEQSSTTIKGVEYCWTCYINAPIPADNSDLPEPGSDIDLSAVVVPRCFNCFVELCEALDQCWTPDERADFCIRCRRHPGRDVVPF